MDGKSGIKMDWPLMAVILTVIISMVTGAIQLGTVQTHVSINTIRIDQMEDRERKAVEDDLHIIQSITRIDEHQKLNEARMSKMESQLDLLLKKVP